MLTTACIALATISLVWWYLRRKYSFWKDQNIPQLRTWPLLGSYVHTNQPLQEIEQENYQKYGKIYGRYDGSIAVISVAEPQILRHVLVKDFHLFSKRRDVKFNDPVFDNTLFSLEGDDWKRVRNIVTPTLTSAKLKRMLPLMEDCCDLLIENIKCLTEKNNAVNLQRIFSAFTIDTIARCSFGIGIDSLRSGEDDPFVAKAKLLLHCKLGWRTFMTVVFPSLMKLFSISLLNPETTQFYRQTILDVMEQRKKIRGREDFLQLLLDVEQNVEVQDQNNNDVKSSKCDDHYAAVETSKSGTIKGLTHDELVAQCVTFFMAGYEATTSLLSHATYSLAMNPQHQQKALEEIQEALDKHNGILNYDSLSELKFMDAVLNECMRLCPSLVRNERRVQMDCQLPTTNIALKKDMLISIPVYAMHRDPEWFPEPDAFHPERFYEVDPKQFQFVHLPFGAGPRVCVGFRFVMMQVKLCLARILLRFQAEPTCNTPVDLGLTEARNILKVNEVEIALVERQPWTLA